MKGYQEGGITPESDCGFTYLIGKELGQGAFGVVHKAEAVDLCPITYDEGAPFAIKFPKDGSKMTLGRMRREISLTDQSGSPHTVEIVDRSLNPEHPYLVMEYVPETLLGLLIGGRINQIVIRNCVYQAPDLLGYLQVKNVTHLDLNPANLGYGSEALGQEVDLDDPNDGTLVILDFGLALPASVKHYPHNAPSSEIPYLPPEFISDGEINLTTDTYSMGKALEILLGFSYYQSTKEWGTMLEFLHGRAPPGSLLEMHAAMTHPDPAERANPARLRELADLATQDLDREEYFFGENAQTGSLDSLRTSFQPGSSLLAQIPSVTILSRLSALQPESPSAFAPIL